MLDGLARQVDLVAVCSSYLRDTFSPRSAELAAITKVVPNGVDTKMFFPKEDARERKTIFFVGRFDAQKGVRELLRAYLRVLRAHPDAKLVIGGTTGFGTHEETPYVKQVRELAASIAGTTGNQVEFSGYIHHDRDLPAYFQRATIFTSPSIFQEPFGLVNAEAMACATPVVGSRRGGIPEVLGPTGDLVDPEDAEEFGTKLSNLLSCPQRCAELGRAAYERCRKLFDWAAIADQWAAELAGTLAQS